jgi:diaminopimelate epimerase
LVRFEKWQALGNDYVILAREHLPFELTPERVRMLCEAHRGIGADGVLLLAPPADPEHVADLRIFNPDGSEAELSGNGAREAALYLRRRGWTQRDEFTIRTAAGPVTPTITGELSCRLDLGQARLSSSDFPSGPPDGRGEVGSWRFRHVSIGNPQCAIAIEDEPTLAAIDLVEAGPPIEAHPVFPNRTNVSWYAELEGGTRPRIRARIFERGVGETLASGTGASGAAVAYVLDARERDAGTQNRGTYVTVVLDGGELEVDVGDDLGVQLSGWAAPVFSGNLSGEFVQELERAA